MLPSNLQSCRSGKGRCIRGTFRGGGKCSIAGDDCKNQGSYRCSRCLYMKRCSLFFVIDRSILRITCSRASTLRCSPYFTFHLCNLWGYSQNGFLSGVSSYVDNACMKFPCYEPHIYLFGIATGYGLDGPGIESRWGLDFPHLSRPALGPTQSLIQ